MRDIPGVPLLALTALLFLGCSTQRMQLAKSEPPQNAPKPDERVRYGFPWSKPKSPPTTSRQMPPELAEQLAKSKVTPAKSNSTAETLQRAGEAEARGDLDSARAAYLQVVEAEPSNVEAHHRLGVIADMRQDPQTADMHYAKAYAANRRDPDLLCDMGYSLLLRNRFEDSERRLKEALEVNPYHRATLSNLGLLYGKQGKYDEALAMFRQAGTESEAQKNIAQLFPNGWPGSKATTVAVADQRPDPPLSLRPQTSTAAPSAPPMPNDIDQRLANLSLDPPSGSVARSGQTLAQLPDLKPSINPGPAAAPPMIPATAMNAAPTSATAVAAKPQGAGQPWVGSLAEPVTPADFAVADAHSPFPHGQPAPVNGQHVMPANWPTRQETWNQPPPAGWPDPSAVQPAGYATSSNPLAMAGAVAGPTTSPPADASRWAAELAFGAGPGSVVPLTSTLPATPASYATPGNGAPGSSVAEFPANGGGWGANPPPVWGTNASAATNAASQPAAWGAGQNLAPPSPWEGSASPAGTSRSWSQFPASAPPPTNFDAAAAPPRSSVPARSGNAWPPANGATSAPPATNPPASWPVIQPAGAATAPATQPPATTYADWPYSASRPN